MMLPICVLLIIVSFSLLTDVSFVWVNKASFNSIHSSIHPHSFSNYNNNWYVGQWVSDTWWYAVWPDPRSRSWRSEMCENGQFQKAVSSANVLIIKRLMVILIWRDMTFKHGKWILPFTRSWPAVTYTAYLLYIVLQLVCVWYRRGSQHCT